MPAATSPQTAPSAHEPMLDTLIVGAGPVGLTMACELLRYGLKVRIVDCLVERSDKSKALAVWPRTMEHLDRLGLAEIFAAAGLHVQSARFFAGDEELAEVRLDAVPTPFAFGLMIPQDQTERLLTEHLEAHGGSIERGVTFQSYVENGDHITATLAHVDGSIETVTARRMIGCDGAHSAVRHAIRADFAGDTLPSDWLLADVHQAAPGTGTRRVETVELHLHADGVLALFPIPPERLRVIANVTRTEPAPDGTLSAEPTPAAVQAILDERGGKGISAANPVWLSSFHINERKVADYRRGNVFLAGDAAHIHSPAGGQGMNTGMQDAFNLAWKLALIHHGELSVAGDEILLASYTAERGPVAAEVIKGSGFLTRMGTLDNAFLRGVRNHAIGLVTSFTRVRHVFAEQVTELAVAYPNTLLNASHGKPGGPKPGDRAPLISNNGTSADPQPVSSGGKPVFTLFAETGSNAAQLIACYPGMIDPQVRPPFVAGGVWIVRPDGYVGFAGNSDGWAAADAYFGKLKWPQGTAAVKLPAA